MVSQNRKVGTDSKTPVHLRSTSLFHSPGIEKPGGFHREEGQQNPTETSFVTTSADGAQSLIRFDLEKNKFLWPVCPRGLQSLFEPDFDIISCLPSVCLDNPLARKVRKGILALLFQQKCWGGRRDVLRRFFGGNSWAFEPAFIGIQKERNGFSERMESFEGVLKLGFRTASIKSTSWLCGLRQVILPLWASAFFCAEKI